MASGLLNSGPLSMNLSPAALLQQQLPQSSPPEQMSEEDKFQERKRDILVLVMRFLADYGYLVTYQSLCVEASMTLDQVDAADNIDLMTIVQEFVDYYHSKFGRYPKLIRHNFPPPVAYQMQQPLPSQQLPQTAMQEMHALQLQAAAAASAAAAAAATSQQAQRQQQAQQQMQQQLSGTGGPQLMLPPPISVSQPPCVLPVAVSAALPTAMDCSLPRDTRSTSAAGTAATTAAGAGSIASQPAAGMQQLVQRHGMQQLSQQQKGTQQITQQPRSLPPAGVLFRWMQAPKGRPNLAASQGTTKRLGSTEALDQTGFVAVLREAPPSELPSKFLEFSFPVRPAGKQSKTRLRSDKINANDIQEEVMYALVGCTDIGWSSRNVSQDTKQFLQQHYNIDKATIATFFKNRSQRQNKPYSQPFASSIGAAAVAAAAANKQPGSQPGAPAGGVAPSSLTGSSSSSGSRGSVAASSKATSRQNNHVAAALPSAGAAGATPAAGAGTAAAPPAGLPPLQVGALQTVGLLAAGNTSSFAAAAAGLAARINAAASSAMTTAAAAAEIATTAAVPDGGYGGLDGMAGFGLCSPSSVLPGLSAAMSLPGSFDNDAYLNGDLDAASDMTLGAGGGGYISPCGFST